MKVYQFPTALSNWIDQQLRALGFNINQSQQLAKAILQVSNDYQEVSSTTPWKDTRTYAAYLSYFFPLNYIRTLKVLDEGKKWGFFNDIEQVVDFGCGPGTSTKAMLLDSDISVDRFHGVDIFSDLKALYLTTHGQSTHLSFGSSVPKVKERGSLLMASYAFNEMSDLPPWLFNFDKIMILEPSTKQAFPKLLEARNSLLEKNYDIVAPCSHVHQCPLSNSKKDWCHDRVYWQQPEWFQKIENALPIKNSSLTFSYLLASRTALPRPKFGRIVGDAMVEKGKTRWMICQGPEREFLSFLKRQGEAPKIYRGDRVQLDVFEKRGDDIRFELDKFKKLD